MKIKGVKRHDGWLTIYDGVVTLLGSIRQTSIPGSYQFTKCKFVKDITHLRFEESRNKVLGTKTVLGDVLE